MVFYGFLQTCNKDLTESYQQFYSMTFKNRHWFWFQFFTKNKLPARRADYSLDNGRYGKRDPNAVYSKHRR